MYLLTIFLTVLMFLDCILLIFLVLLQLPKKDAGAGLAFGGAATDALFGAGSGNVLTKITKYVAGIFFGLAILMALIAGHRPPSDAAALAQTLLQRNAAPSAPSSQPAPSSPQTPPASTPPPGSPLLQLSNVAPVTPSSAPPPATPPAKTNK